MCVYIQWTSCVASTLGVRSFISYWTICPRMVSSWPHLPVATESSVSTHIHTHTHKSRQRAEHTIRYFSRKEISNLTDVGYGRRVVCVCPMWIVCLNLCRKWNNYGDRHRHAHRTCTTQWKCKWILASKDVRQTMDERNRVANSAHPFDRLMDGYWIAVLCFISTRRGSCRHRRLCGVNDAHRTSFIAIY